MRRKRQLMELENGSVFVCPWNGQVGKLVEVRPGHAVVELAPKTTKFTTEEGQEVSFTKSARTEWSAATVVEVEEKSKYSMK